MFVGHVAIALGAQATGKRLRLYVYVVAAFLPDLLRAGLDPVMRNAETWTHSAASIATQALILVLITYLITRDWRCAWALGAACALHFPADFITGCKYLWPYGPRMGLLLYRWPVIDVALEVAFLVGMWRWWRRRAESSVASRIWWVAGVALLQVPLLAVVCASSDCQIGSTWWRWRSSAFVRLTTPRHIGLGWRCTD
jgi:hypothetical protein